MLKLIEYPLLHYAATFQLFKKLTLTIPMPGSAKTCFNRPTSRTCISPPANATLSQISQKCLMETFRETPLIDGINKSFQDFPRSIFPSTKPVKIPLRPAILFSNGNPVISPEPFGQLHCVGDTGSEQPCGRLDVSMIGWHIMWFREGLSAAVGMRSIARI